MAPASIPVQTRAGGYNNDPPPIVVQLPYDTLVIVADEIPAVEDIEIFPYAAKYRRQYVPEGGHPKFYEIRYAKDYLGSRWEILHPRRKEARMYWSPRPGRTRLAGRHVEEPHPNAGKLITRRGPIQIHRLRPGERVLFLQDGVWNSGEVQDYEHVFDAKRAKLKQKLKIADKARKRSRYPTIWDRLSDD